MKICIISNPLKTNYGGILQAFALQKVLKNLGHTPVSDNYFYRDYFSFKPWLRPFARAIYKFLKPVLQLGRVRKKDEITVAQNTRKFIEKYIATADVFEHKAPSDEALLDFDAVLVGSDQIWRAEYINPDYSFLTYLKALNIKRISYAASFGLDYPKDYSPRVLRRCKKALQKFDAVGVREKSGLDICRKYFGQKAVQCLDPTLLLHKKDYLELLGEPQQNTKTVACYFLDPSYQKEKLGLEIAEKLDLTINNLHPAQRLSSVVKNIDNCIFDSVENWLEGIANADFVVTDSFHGLVFSLIFNKDFVVFDNEGRGSDRFNSLVQMLDLKSRIYKEGARFEEKMLDKIDYSAVNILLESQREFSLNFLVNSLK